LKSEFFGPEDDGADPAVEMIDFGAACEEDKIQLSRGGSGLHLDIAILHGVFAFAIDVELLNGKNNSVKFEKYPGK
jgi:hypothetical protein